MAASQAWRAERRGPACGPTHRSFCEAEPKTQRERRSRQRALRKERGGTGREEELGERRNLGARREEGEEEIERKGRGEELEERRSGRKWQERSGRIRKEWREEDPEKIGSV